jgi:hypothetical protein
VHLLVRKMLITRYVICNDMLFVFYITTPSPVPITYAVCWGCQRAMSWQKICWRKPLGHDLRYFHYACVEDTGIQGVSKVTILKRKWELRKTGLRYEKYIYFKVNLHICVIYRVSVVSVVCCQVEVCATDWSLVKRSHTDCDASLCVT